MTTITTRRRIDGTPNNDQLKGNSGDDEIYGQAGNDDILGDGGRDWLYGGDGNDVLDGGRFWLATLGRWARDFYGDYLDGGAGDDILYGSVDRDTLDGGSGNDELYGNGGNDVMSGGLGDDLLVSGHSDGLFRSVLVNNGGDKLDGGGGNDELFGGDGNDELKGGEGNDFIFGASGYDQIIGGAGDDRLYSGGEFDPDVNEVGPDSAGDFIDGGDGNDLLVGAGKDDLLKGGAGDDKLTGGGGRNLLYGGDGNDSYVITSRGDYVYDSAGVDSGVINVDWYKPAPEVENWTWAEGVQKLPYWIDALTESYAPDNALSLGAGRTIHYVFAQAPMAGFKDTDKAGFVAFNAEQASYVRKMLDYVETLIDVRFVETTYVDADIFTIVFGNNQQPDSSGYSRFLSSTAQLVALDAGDARLLAPGKDSGKTFLDVAMHELGHALGLKHPFSQPDAYGNSDLGPFLPELEDHAAITRMSYDGEPADPGTFGALDVAALQYIFGVAPGMHAGDSVYELDAAVSSTLIDGAGTDVLDLSAQTLPITLHLEAGYWNHIGAKAQLFSAPGQFTINFGTVIEDALGGSAADLIVGNASNNILLGGGGDDTLDGQGGNDALAGGAGNDTLSGQDGMDFAFYEGTRSAFTLSKANLGWVLNDSSGAEGRDTLAGIERIVFKDSAIALDIDGLAGQAYRVYVAAFDRKPELAGLGFWLEQLDNGLSLKDMAAEFVKSDEFTKMYGATRTMDSFLGKLYNNVLHRAPDQAGVDYWIGLMRNGFSEAEVLAAFSESAENKAQVIGSIENGIDYLPFG